jgi:hypothetical protein
MRTSTRRTLSRAAVAVAASALSACAPADATPWATFSPEGGAFTVAMPGTPEREQQFAQNESGTVDTRVYTLLLDRGGFFKVVDLALPANVDVKAGADAVLDSAVVGVVDSASARLVSRQKIFVSNRPGRQVEAEVPESAVPGGGTLKARIYLVGPRLYELVAVVPKADAAGSAPARFLDSFELKEPQT